ncbi:Non-histone protein 10 [Podospora aff. communis PSN243]|uniref:Non-histone protein 10 n=1 Tax=Podospora aff. communis PSN243 TaxID=3040156 RepID=A0AAV9H655_9PEZI|nr:Non-histone protein 10 [Podospora aff. communis PSN243]
MAPATATPPALPPSVEEAYRRKCIQLKQRTAEVEEANDAARLRLARLKRQVEKMRLERAFLLEQLAKRTSANVEDSDGSPSPPPTVSPPNASASFPPPNHSTSSMDHRRSSGNKLNNLSSSQPKEKPLRIKRGHRKPSMLNSFDTPTGGSTSTPGAAGASFVGSQNLQQTHSPSSDAFSTQPGEGKANGVRFFPPKKPGSAFELYCDERRAEQRKEKEQQKEDKDDTEEGGGAEAEEDEQRLARDWKDLGDTRREEFQTRADDELAKYHKEKDAYDAKEAAKKDADEEMDVDNERRGVSASLKEADDTPQPQEDQDVEMGNYESDQETQGEKPEE